MTGTNDQIICPDCGVEVKKSESMEIGDILECQECGTEVEILSIEPLQFKELVEEK